MYKYIGKGAFLIGVPARDLTDEEAQKYGVKIVEGSGLYVHIGAPAPQSKRLRSGKTVTETADKE